MVRENISGGKKQRLDNKLPKDSDIKKDTNPYLVEFGFCTNMVGEKLLKESDLFLLI